MSNLYTAFKKLLPDQPLLIGVVVELAVDGCLIRLPSGDILRARGAADLGRSVFFSAGVIEGYAPDLPVVQIDI